ncbi:MAG: CoA transferase [bacterium]|jgi:crotonobetainyl-CoA:carnitine CoA-transferase CaiB-like acyl-CoA transferase|nr:carnitine dehydratase [Deltaproteobacteria bacterium]MCP4242667.1 CoA transferase [bacterium]MDP7570512.1 CoA transferase [Myxococcota bacterium]
MAGVLDGIRVLDLSWGSSGPIATMLLADHGAEVTKIEPPGGDPFRSQLGYHAWNRGKRSAVVDLKAAEDLAVFRKLAARADVLVESFRPGVTQRLGIDYATLSAANPRLIYCSITGYGRDNSHSDRPGYDALVAARVGLHWEQRGRVGGSAAHLSRKQPFAPDYEVPREAQQGPPRDGPVFPASRFPSLGAAYSATLGISAALRAREVTGRGQWIETSLMQGAFASGVMAYGVAENIEAQHYQTWIGDSRAPKGLFECSDGRWVHAWPPSPRFILGTGEGDTLRPTADHSAREDPDRIALGPEELFVLHHYWEPMATTMRKFTADEWTQAGADAGVCIQKIRSPEEALSDPLLVADGCVADLDDPELGAIRTVGVTYKLGNSPGHVGAAQPPIGRDTQAVRAEAEAATAQAPTDTGAQLPGGPLEGIRVLDFGLAVAGPYATQILSDLGAEVIKVNALHDWYWHSNQIAMCCNRGKRSIAINLKHPEAKAAIDDLIASADVLMHNMRYPAAVKLGIDYETLKEHHPRLVYCHTRGHERGPRENLPGNDQTGACLAGVEWEDGGCGRGGRPMWSLTNMGDTGNGFLAAIAMCQALYEREKTGKGQWVETAIVNAQLINTSHSVARADGSGFARPQLDPMQTGFSAGVRLYPTSDGWLCLSLVSEAHWQALAGALALDELREGGRFGSAQARAAADDEVAKLVEHVLATRSAADWMETLDAAGVPCEVSSEHAGIDLWSAPEAIARRWIAKYSHPMVGEVGQVGVCVDLSDTPSRVQGRPLLVGEDTREILRELGYGEAAIDALFEAGAVNDEHVYPALAGDGAVAESPWVAKKD